MRTAKRFAPAFLSVVLFSLHHAAALAESPLQTTALVHSLSLSQGAPSENETPAEASEKRPPTGPQLEPAPAETKPLVTPEPDDRREPLPEKAKTPAEALTTPAQVPAPAAEAPPAAPPSPSPLAGALGAASGPGSAALYMIGDLFGGGSSQTIAVQIPIVKGSGGARGFRPADQASSFISGDGQELFLTPGAYSGGADQSGDGLADTWQLTEVIANPGSQLLLYGNSSSYSLDPNSSTGTLNGGTPGDPAIDGDVTDIPFSEGRLAFQAVVPSVMQVVLPPPNAWVGVTKISENNSVFPKDRVFFNYSFFNDVRLTSRDSMDVNRFTFGIEKTFRGGMSSLELRVPFASTLNSDQHANGVDLGNTEFGNLGLIFKRLLGGTERTAWVAGLGMTFPTAEDARLLLNDGTPILQIHNDAVHLMPFLGVYATSYNRRFFVQSFLQVDVGVNENSARGDIVGSANLPTIGRLYDQTQLFADIELGYWLYRNWDAPRLTGVVPILELHYETSLQDADQVQGNGIGVTSLTNRYDHLNLTAGGHFVCGERSTITPALVVPLRSGDDRQFDAELQVQMNVWY